MFVIKDDVARIRDIYQRGSQRERASHVRQVVDKAWALAIVGNTVAATMTAVIQGVTNRAYLQDQVVSDYFRAFVVIGGSLYAAAIAAMYVVARLFLGRRMRWFAESRPAARREIARLARLPRFVAIANGSAWAVYALVFFPIMMYVGGFNYTSSALVKQGLTHAYGFVVATAIVYVTVERVFSPYLQLALPHTVDDWPASLGLSTRLLVTWFAVAGAPLLLITGLWIGWSDEQRNLAAPGLRVTGAVAIAVGLLAFVVAGRTITTPLRRLQDAMRHVATGDLAIHVEVDQAAELGHVEAGFNDMVDGLRTLESSNEELQAALRTQLQAVQESRVRIVEAADAERARIERNLHDGAQQRLLSLAFTLREVERILDGERPAEAGERVQASLKELDAAMTELRELARGIHPAILDEEGLGPALSSLGDRAAVEVELNVQLPERLPTAVEVSAYFVVAEALTNIARYADASKATVEATATDGVLHLRVRDDGKGGADPRQGSGLRGLSDRISALGGTFEVDSPEGAGTTVSARIPCA